MHESLLKIRDALVELRPQNRHGQGSSLSIVEASRDHVEKLLLQWQKVKVVIKEIMHESFSKQEDAAEKDKLDSILKDVLALFLFNCCKVCFGVFWCFL